MATDIVSSLEMLPVELLHRICDSLDTETLLLSLRYVCKRLYSVIQNYNRCNLDFKSIYKYKFHQLGRSADPYNVVSLTLSDENQTCGQIELFLSLYHIENYTRLQSITLISIGEPYLKIILQHLSTHCFLMSLLIHGDSYTEWNAESIAFLLSIIGRNCFHKLDLTAGYKIIDALEWPTECSIRHLRLSDSIEFNQFSTILHRSPHLKTMILRDCVVDDVDTLKSAISDNLSYQQLTALTLEDCELEMMMIESLLSLTPSLVHLTVKGNGRDYFDGARWERLFQIKLPNLNKFEFAFQNNMAMNCDVANFEAVIAPFQTEFWLESKRWFISVIGVKKSSWINLHSIPDCAPKITFHPKANKVSRSTVPSVIGNLITLNSVRELTLDLIEMQADMTEKEEISIHRWFNKLTKLILRLIGDWPSSSLELLSSLIDLSTITELELNIDFTRGDMLRTIAGIVALLERTTRIRSLIIPLRKASLQTICSIVSDRIQHLEIPVNTVEEMKVILQRFDHLSSVRFQFVVDSLTTIEETVQWLITTGRDFTHQSTPYSLTLWLGKQTKG